MGAGYEVDSSTARALASSANQSAPTIFNFSSPNSWFSSDTQQTSTPTATATAATKSPGTTGPAEQTPAKRYTATAPPLLAGLPENPSLPLILIAALAAIYLFKR